MPKGVLGMQSINLNKSERLRKRARLKSLMMAGLAASLIAPVSANAQGLPGADAIGNTPPTDEQIVDEPVAPVEEAPEELMLAPEAEALLAKQLKKMAKWWRSWRMRSPTMGV